jgi:hypothetical protein
LNLKCEKQSADDAILDTSLTRQAYIPSLVLAHATCTATSREVYRRVYQRLGAAGLVHADGRNAAPSGIEGLTFAAAICERVHVYGFHTDVPKGAKVGAVTHLFLHFTPL